MKALIICEERNDCQLLPVKDASFFFPQFHFICAKVIKDEDLLEIAAENLLIVWEGEASLLFREIQSRDLIA